MKTKTTLALLLLIATIGCKKGTEATPEIDNGHRYEYFVSSDCKYCEINTSKDTISIFSSRTEPIKVVVSLNGKTKEIGFQGIVEAGKTVKINK